MRDLHFARTNLRLTAASPAPTPADVARLEAALKASQDGCSPHAPNPERSTECLHCSALIQKPAERPPLAKARRKPLEIVMPARKAVG